MTFSLYNNYLKGSLPAFSHPSFNLLVSPVIFYSIYAFFNLCIFKSVSTLLVTVDCFKNLDLHSGIISTWYLFSLFSQHFQNIILRYILCKRCNSSSQFYSSQTMPSTFTFVSHSCIRIP